MLYDINLISCASAIRKTAHFTIEIIEVVLEYIGASNENGDRK